jgi:plastocyanin
MRSGSRDDDGREGVTMTGVRRFATIAVLATIGAAAGVTAANAGGGGHCEPSEGGGGVVELSGACFLPSTLHADTGDTITFVNRDPFVHNVSGTGWGQYDDLAQGELFSTSFLDEGLYPFACTLHPGMNGVILVGQANASETTAAAQSITRTTSGPGGGNARVAAGAMGLLLGAAVGAGAMYARRRATGPRPEPLVSDR